MMKKSIGMALCLLCSNCEHGSQQYEEEFDTATQEEHLGDTEKETEEGFPSEPETTSSEEEEIDTEPIPETDTIVEIDTYTEPEIDTYVEVETDTSVEVETDTETDTGELETDTVELDSEGCYVPITGATARVHSREDMEYFSQFECIKGDVYISMEYPPIDVVLLKTKRIKGMLSMGDYILSVKMPNLEYVGHVVFYGDSSSITELEFPSLETISGMLGITKTLITSLDGLSALKTVEEGLTISSNEGLHQCEACSFSSRVDTASLPYIKSNKEDECSSPFYQCPTE